MTMLIIPTQRTSTIQMYDQATVNGNGKTHSEHRLRVIITNSSLQYHTHDGPFMSFLSLSISMHQQFPDLLSRFFAHFNLLAAGNKLQVKKSESCLEPVIKMELVTIMVNVRVDGVPL